MKYRYLKAGDGRRAGDEFVARNGVRCPECSAYVYWGPVYDDAIGMKITKVNTRSILYRRPIKPK